MTNKEVGVCCGGGNHSKSRAERVPATGPLLYSEVDSLTWHLGNMKNVSSTGVLFAGNHPVPSGKQIEMTFMAAPEVFGTAERVYSTAIVVRREASSEAGERARMGARITMWRRLSADQGATGFES